MNAALKMAVVAALFMRAAVRAQENPHSLKLAEPLAHHELAAHAVPLPKVIVAVPPAAISQQTVKVIDTVKAAQGPLATRAVFATHDGAVVRLTDDNINEVLSKPTLTAERLGQLATKVEIPAVLASKLGSHVEAFTLPTRFTALAFPKTAADHSTEVPASANPVAFNVLFAILDGLHYDGSAGKFVARLALALVNPANRNDTSALTHEVPILLAADGADISPVPVRLSALNAPLEIRLAVQGPLDPYSVRAMTALNTAADSIIIPVRRPAIEVRPVSDRIRGFGLEETTVTVRILEAQGRRGEFVTLQARPGSISPSPVALDETGTGVAVLRSVSTGAALITATDPPFSPGSAAVRFEWPIVFVIATLFGGTLGALLRKDARRRRGRSVVIGVSAAFLVTIAHAVGITSGTWGTPGGAAGNMVFFVIAAVAGFLGREAMSLLTKTAAK